MHEQAGLDEEDWSSDPTCDFFQRVSRDRPVMLPDDITATLRIDLEHDGQTGPPCPPGPARRWGTVDVGAPERERRVPDVP